MAVLLGAAGLSILVLRRARARQRRLGWPRKALEPYTLLFTPTSPARGAAARAQLRVTLAPQHDRRTHPTDVTRIERVWESKLTRAAASGGKLFDQSKFRLHAIKWTGGATRGPPIVDVCLGLTSYKEYVGTNLIGDDERRVLEADGTTSHADPCAHLSNALGCETILLTSDEQVVLLRRSSAVSTGTGLYNGPSGHAEPSHARIDQHAQDPDAMAEAAERAADELFGAILQEVHDETNVPIADLSAPLLIGAMADSSRKPDLLFVTMTRLDADRVRAAYAQGANEGWESDRLAFWPSARLAECEDELPLTAVTRAAHECFAMLTSCRRG